MYWSEALAQIYGVHASFIKAKGGTQILRDSEIHVNIKRVYFSLIVILMISFAMKNVALN